MAVFATLRLGDPPVQDFFRSTDRIPTAWPRPQDL